MRLGLGWIPDPPPSDEERATHLAATQAIGAVAPPVDGGLVREPWILDQGNTEACTGHWAVQSLWGLVGFRGSPYVPWWLARATDLHPGARIENVGVSTFACVRTVNRHGVPPWEAWNPTSPSFDPLRPPPALAKLEAQRHKLDVTPIWDVGDAGIDAVCAALAAGLPVGIVVEADPVFERATDGFVGPESGASRGKHMGTLWRYRTASDVGSKEFLFVNQWGLSWATRGTAWMSEARLRSSPFLCFARVQQ